MRSYGRVESVNSANSGSFGTNRSVSVKSKGKAMPGNRHECALGCTGQLNAPATRCVSGWRSVNRSASKVEKTRGQFTSNSNHYDVVRSVRETGPDPLRMGRVDG